MDVDPGRYIKHHIGQIDRDRAEGKVTRQTADAADYFYHRTVTYKDGRTPYQVRRNGRTQTWRTRPNEFRIPIKIGFRGYGEITDRNADEWSTKPLPLKPSKEELAKKKRDAMLQKADIVYSRDEPILGESRR